MVDDSRELKQAGSQAPLQFERVGRRYSRRRPWAVRNVSFEVPRGAIAALVGPNGAGKSTLIRACVGFESPDEGRVLVNGYDPQKQRTPAVNSLGYVPQAASLYRGLSISDHLAMASSARHNFDRAYALRRLIDAGLSEDRKVAELSGGEQAQVALALALGTRAQVLLLDEPLASLDPLARRDFLTALVDDVRGRGSTAVLSSHIVTDVEQACDRMVVLGDGHLLLDAAIADAKRRFGVVEPQQVPNAELIGTFAGPDGRVLGLTTASLASRPASLEEIVLGHLAAARARRAMEPAA